MIRRMMLTAILMAGCGTPLDPPQGYTGNASAEQTISRCDVQAREIEQEGGVDAAVVQARLDFRDAGVCAAACAPIVAAERDSGRDLLSPLFCEQVWPF